MQLPALNVNIIIIAILLGVALYGLFAGKQRLRILILSVYVGIVLSTNLASHIASRQTSFSPEQIGWLLFGVPILIFGAFGIAHHPGHDRGAFIANLLVGLVTGALIISSALHLMSTGQMADISNESFLASNLVQYHLWLLGLLPLIALVMGFMSGEKKHHR